MIVVEGDAIDRTLLAVAFAALYGFSAAPHPLGGDAALFATIFADGGYAHPPGYPLYSLYLMATSWLPAASPAHGASIATSFLGVGAVVLLHDAARRWGLSRFAAAVAAVSFGIASGVWRYQTQPEVFALNHLIAASILVFAAPDAPAGGVRRAGALGLLAGLGLANHHTIVLVAPVGIYGPRERRPPVLPGGGLRCRPAGPAALPASGRRLTRGRWLALGRSHRPVEPRPPFPTVGLRHLSVDDRRRRISPRRTDPFFRRSGCGRPPVHRRRAGAARRGGGAGAALGPNRIAPRRSGDHRGRRRAGRPRIRLAVDLRAGGGPPGTAATLSPPAGPVPGAAGGSRGRVARAADRPPPDRDGPPDQPLRLRGAGGLADRRSSPRRRRAPLSSGHHRAPARRRRPDRNRRPQLLRDAVLSASDRPPPRHRLCRRDHARPPLVQPPREPATRHRISVPRRGRRSRRTLPSRPTDGTPAVPGERLPSRGPEVLADGPVRNDDPRVPRADDTAPSPRSLPNEHRPAGPLLTRPRPSPAARLVATVRPARLRRQFPDGRSGSRDGRRPGQSPTSTPGRRSLRARRLGAEPIDRSLPTGGSSRGCPPTPWARSRRRTSEGDSQRGRDWRAVTRRPRGLVPRVHGVWRN
ncbi:MAG: protein O-mannosyl-transferase family [Bradymonadaceae bacterium]